MSPLRGHSIRPEVSSQAQSWDDFLNKIVSLLLDCSSQSEGSPCVPSEIKEESNKYRRRRRGSPTAELRLWGGGVCGGGQVTRPWEPRRPRNEARRPRNHARRPRNDARRLRNGARRLEKQGLPRSVPAPPTADAMATSRWGPVAPPPPAPAWRRDRGHRAGFGPGT